MLEAGQPVLGPAGAGQLVPLAREQQQLRGDASALELHEQARALLERRAGLVERDVAVAEEALGVDRGAVAQPGGELLLGLVGLRVVLARSAELRLLELQFPEAAVGLERLDLLLGINPVGPVLNDEDAERIAGPQEGDAQEGVVNLFAGLRPVREGGVGLGVGAGRGVGLAAGVGVEAGAELEPRVGAADDVRQRGTGAADQV